MIRFDNLPPEVMQAMCTPMHQVLPPIPIPSPTHPGTQIFSGALFIGSMSAIHEKELLKENGVTHMVQVLDIPWLPTDTGPPPSNNSNPSNGANNGVVIGSGGMSYLRIDILDQTTADLRPHLENACSYIDKALRSGHSVLVHCQQGISRSAAVVIAYLIRNHGMTYESAFNHLRRKRACVKPNPGFVKILQEWEVLWRRPNNTRRFTT